MSNRLMPHNTNDSLLWGFGQLLISVIAEVFLVHFGHTKRPPWR